MTLRAVVLAPAHADGDMRVRRAVRAVGAVSDWTDVFWDGDYPGHSRSGQLLGERGAEHYVLPRAKWRTRAAIGASPFAPSVRAAIAAAQLVHVHASGIDGLLLAAAARREMPRGHIIFDYHDSLPFELSYQLRKRGIAWAFNCAWPMHRVGLRRWARAVDSVIGISPEQLKQYGEIVGREPRALAIPNMREFGPSIRLGAVAPPDVFDVVWVGQIMRGRDLGRLVDWMAGTGPEVRLRVNGGVLHPEVVGEVRKVLGERAVFDGAFAGDAALAARLHERSVGVFLGWDDLHASGINEIASPNKFYSYVNLGLPVILDRRLTGLVRDVERHGAGIAVASAAEFASAVRTLERETERFRAGMRALRTEYAARDLGRELEHFIRRGAIAAE